MTSLSEEYPRILRDYLELSISLTGKYMKILKTDLFNEVRGFPKKGGIIGNIEGDIHAIDIDIEIVNKVIKMGFKNVRWGDIRKLPYPDNEFHVVIDLSTIDHVAEFELVLSEYNRVLKIGGTIGIVYWSTSKKSYNDEHQFYFRKTDFAAETDKYFKKQREWKIYKDPDHILRGYTGVKQ